MPDNRDTGQPTAERLRQAGQELHDAIRVVVDEIPAPHHTPQHLAQTLRLHRTLASRLLNALRADDPLAAVNRMPRTEGLRKFLAAARSNASRDAITQADAAVSAFDHFVHGELGGWDGLDAAVTEWLPEAREKYELANKQLAFKGLSNLAGVRAEVQLVTSIYYPDAAGARSDIAIIDGLAGLMRLRPGARVRVGAVGPNPHEPKPLPDGAAPEEGLDEGYPLLSGFCTPPDPPVRAVRHGELTSFILEGDEIGAKSSVDIFTASVVRSTRPMYRAANEPPHRVSGSAGLTVPAKTFLMTVLLHDDIWPDTEPELYVYDTHFYGHASPNDPARDIDRINVVESVHALGRGASRFRASEVGRHVEMVQHVCAALGWDSGRLRGYRCRVQYPILHAQYCMVMGPPPCRGE